MKKHTIIAIFLFVLLAIACKRTTMINGVVTDSGTGLPIDGVEVHLIASRFAKHGGTLGVDKDTVTTGTDGAYALEVSTARADYAFLRYIKKGYISYSPDVERGDCKQFDAVLNPIDAYINFTIINESQSPGLHIGVTGNMYLSGNSGKDFYKLSDIPSTYLLKVPGGDNIQIYWDKEPITSYAKAAYTSTILCPRNDTTEFLLKF
jgi:hypothetical protein